MTNMLFPRDVLKPRLADEHFRAEADAARNAGLEIQLIDHDAIVADDISTGLRGIEGPGSGYVYRGWMITPIQYVAMFDALTDRGIALRADPDSFQRAHHLPRWYRAMEATTPRSVWTATGDWGEFDTALSALGAGAAVLKDYSKSEKHYWNEAMFIPDVEDVAAARTVAERFVELRGQSFDTGFVLRCYEDLSSVEARTWWVDGECVAVSAHPDTPEQAPSQMDLGQIGPHVAELGLPFISVDVALSNSSQQPRVVEIGDGQVSDRPNTFDPDEFIAKLARQS